MVCSNYFKSKYTRFLIKYHLFIFCSILIMTIASIGLVIYKHDQIHFRNLLKGFLAHGTKSSDEYRKLIALIHETQITHLFPHSTNSKTFQQTPYASFNPHINPCSKRFYLSTCPILPYTELTFDFYENSVTLFDDIDTFKSICKLEWHLRTRFTNCSTATCCQYVGPVDLLFDGNFLSSDQCDNLTIDQLKEYHSQWSICNSSICPNSRLHYYLSHQKSFSTFKIYLHIANDSNKSENLIYLYDNLHNFQYNNKYHLSNINFNSNEDEQILFNYLFSNNLIFIYITISLYFLCLLLFIKNLFIIFIIILNIYLTIISTFFIYIYLLNFPLTILNYTSLILYLFLILIDSFLWYTCWFINNHRRDDCTINRIIENLLTQIFYYLLPKNLTAIIVCVITYTNQIITLQSFTVLSFLFILISFFISFILYPVSFILILQYQSYIVSFERFLNRLFTINTTRCFIDRTIPCLIVRLKGFWLCLLTLIACIAFIIIYQWPKLEFNICQITFDTLPFHLTNKKTPEIKSLDIDVTYYIGSHWEVPNESMIPMRDIPILAYNYENRMTSTPGAIDTFEYALEKNLSQLIDFCAQVKLHKEKQDVNEKRLIYKHYYRHITSQNLDQNRMDESSTQNQLLTINNIHCFGDLSSANSSISLSETKFAPIIQSYQNESINCTYICHSNKTSDTYDCILCLNSLYYNSYQTNDLFLIKNGLRFMNDGKYPRYLFQTVNYKWNILTNVNNYIEWKILNEYLKRNLFVKFYKNTFTHMSFWWSSEFFSTYNIMEQLEQEKYYLIGIKFLVILIFLLLFTGILGIFVTLTTFANYVTCIAILTLFNYKLTIENMSYFTIVLIICSQYSVLYSISYKLAPTFFFQRENRTMYSVKQLCTTLFHITLSIILISIPCLFSSFPYLFKTSSIYILSSLISLIYSTFFLQSLLCYIGPSDHKCLFIPWRCQFARHTKSNTTNLKDLSSRKYSTNSRRHQRMSTSSYFASSYFSQIFTGSTYFESEYGGINETLAIGSRRRESSRSHQISHIIKRNSLLTGELIELYTPRASLAPYGHYQRYSRQSSVPRGVPTRPLYVSQSMSPYSQLSIHSQVGSGRPRSPSPQIFRPSRSPSPHSFARLTTTTSSLRPCYSAPRLHAPIHRTQTTTVKQMDTLLKDISTASNQYPKKNVMIIQRQDAISILDDHEQLSAATKRTILKETMIDSTATVWLKRSNSS